MMESVFSRTVHGGQEMDNRQLQWHAPYRGLLPSDSPTQLWINKGIDH